MNLLLGLLLLASPAAAAETVPDTAWVDQDGRWRQLSRHKDSPRLALIAYDERVVETARRVHARKDADVWLLRAEPGLDRAAFRADRVSREAGVPCLWDAGLSAVGELGLSRRGEAVLIDPGLRRVLYRGDALGLEAHLDGRKVSVPAAGEPLPALPPVVDFAKAGALFRDRCLSCHARYSSGKEQNYDFLSTWRGPIRESILEGRMPPSAAEDHDGLFQADVTLSSAERRALIDWLKAGLPRAAGPDPLAGAPALAQWPLGAPSLILRAAAQKIPASGAIPYRYLPLGEPLAADAWVGAVVTRPGNHRVLHHANLLAFVPSAEEPDGGYARFVGERRYKEFWRYTVSGKGQDRPFPAGTGLFFPRGTRFLLQAHYTPWGREAEDLTEVGLYFVPGPLRRLRLVSIEDLDLDIPPGAAEVPARAEWTLPEDGELAYVHLHMHARGSRIALRAVLPGGQERPLLTVARWLPTHQPFYFVKDRLALPAGTKLVVEGAFDNSYANPLNPDPSKRVKSGPMTDEHEMFHARVGWAPAR